MVMLLFARYSKTKGRIVYILLNHDGYIFSTFSNLYSFVLFI